MTLPHARSITALTAFFTLLASARANCTISDSFTVDSSGNIHESVVRKITVSYNGYTLQSLISNQYSDPLMPLKIRGSFTKGSQNFFKYTTVINPSKSGTATVLWGAQTDPATQGADIRLNNGYISGAIKGRAFASVKLDGITDASFKFRDGLPAPTIKPLPADAQAALQVLVRRAKNQADSCTVVTPTTTPARGLLNRDQGAHFSQTRLTKECGGCVVAAFVAFAAAEVACVVACAPTFGLGCVPCVLAAGLALEGAIVTCQESQLCCPIACGEPTTFGLQRRCCFGSETCLDGKGLCCAAGTTHCFSKGCCASDQTCISSGALQGLCCPTAATCGANCCADNEVCADAAAGVCCPSGTQCGKACCMNGPFSVNVCLNAATSTCCDSQSVCNGKCCASGQRCINGVCTVVQCPGDVCTNGICPTPTGKWGCDSQSCCTPIIT